MSRFKELDEAIVAAVNEGAREFGRIVSRVHEQAEKLLPSKWHSVDRVVDRRLQALRKAGRLVFVRGGRGWSITEAA